MAKKNQKARNERERKRVHQVNHGFDILRNRLQPKNHTKKWSKADTLREAVKYIQQLQHLLNNEQAQQPVTSSSDFGHHHGTGPGDFANFPIKEEFSMYLPQAYHHQNHAPMSSTSSGVNTFNNTSSPTSSIASSYSPTSSSSQLCYQTPNYNNYHHH